MIAAPITTAGWVVTGPGRRIRSQRLGERHLPQRFVRPGPRRCSAVEPDRCVIGQTALLGDDMHHRRTGGGTIGRPTLRISAPAGQPVTAVGQRSQRIRAALLQGARIGIADRPRHRIQALIQRRRVMAEQRALDPRQAAAFVVGADVDVAASGAELATAQRVRVVAIHPVVDACSVLATDNDAQPPTAAANSVSTLASASGSVINAVR
jgi:hypothetical protein